VEQIVATSEGIRMEAGSAAPTAAFQQIHGAAAEGGDAEAWR
jgi:hypothetical protein